MSGDYIEVNLDNVDELIEIKTNLVHASLPSQELIDRFLNFSKPFSIPYLPIRDITLYDTLIYLSQTGLILSGGYGINSCFFNPDERRLSLADIDFIYHPESELSVESIIAEANSLISEKGGAIRLTLGEKDTVIGLFTLNIEKMKWLRRIGVEDAYSYKRSVLYPPIGNYSLRGQPILDYLRKQGFSKSKRWMKFAREIKKLHLTNFRVESIEVDVVTEKVNSVKRRVNPLLEILDERKLVKTPIEARVIHPEDASKALYEALRYFMKKNQTHNAVKTIIDLRIARDTSYMNKVRDIAKIILENRKYEEEYERGFESWRFILLKKKYARLRDLIEKWFLR